VVTKVVTLVELHDHILRREKDGQMSMRHLEFAKKTPKGLWEPIISCLMNLSSKCHVWRKPGTAHHLHNSIPMVKCGGSIMLWGCFSATGTGWLVRVDGKLNRARYRDNLNENLVQSIQKLGLARSSTLQKDYDPKHTTKTMQEWLFDYSVNVLEWPSPELGLEPNHK